MAFDTPHDSGSRLPDDHEHALVDSFGRRVSYLRISVTDRCNLQCKYCMPAGQRNWLNPDSLLTFEEIGRFARTAAGEGISKIRITGGEPLTRQNLPDLARDLSRIPGIRDLAMTTNATLLAQHADELKAAGIMRVNISLDTLRRDRFIAITGADMIEQVCSGITRAIEAGLSPVKINMVVIRGINDDEIADIARLTLDAPLDVRFIEHMPIGAGAGDWDQGKIVACSHMRRTIESVFGALEEIDPPASGAAGPVRAARIKSASGRIGFISPVSEVFCSRCNRMRLTADGRLRSCLLNDGEVDIRAAYRAGAGDGDIREMLRRAVTSKPESHQIKAGNAHCTLAKSVLMNRIGG